MTNQNLPLMPKATAVWLVENTSLTFRQIADFCGMHELEVRGIADGEVAVGIPGFDPIISGQLTREEIDRCEQDSLALLYKCPDPAGDAKVKIKKSKYTPIAKRQDKPDAIYWLIKNYPNITEKQITRLIGTTKAMIAAIKEKTHWNIKNIRPRDPVMLGLCSQRELDELIESLNNEHQNKQHTR